MSEVSGGPGWWQASDGRWYPPESYPAGWPPRQEASDPGTPESPGSSGSTESGAGGPIATGTGPGGPAPTPGQYPPGQYQQSQHPPGQYPPGQYGGSSPYFQSPPPFTPAAKTNGLAIAALVCSILWGFGVLSVVAIVLGFVARSQIRRTRENGNGLALAGIIVGGVGIVGAIVSIIILAAVGTYIDEEFNTDARVQLTADSDVCWEIEISNLDSDLNRDFEGCGPASFDLGRGIGRRAEVTKVTGVGPISAILLVEGESRDFETIIEQFETAELSP